MNKTCVECDATFDTQSREKRRAGGLATHCPDCSVDDTVRYLGISAGEGKLENLYSGLLALASTNAKITHRVVN